MSYLTRYGTIWGQIPRTTGRMFWVAPAASYTIEGRSFSSSDNHDGLSPERALRTIANAITLATASVGDVILLLEGTHTVTAAIAVSKAGLTFWGVGSSPERFNAFQPRTIIAATGTSVPLFNITAGNTEIGFVDLRPTTAYSAISFQTLSAINGFYLHDFHIDLETPAVSIGTFGVDFAYRTAGTFQGDSAAKLGSGAVSAVSNVLIEDGVIESDGAQGMGIVTATCYGLIRNVRLYNSVGTWATPFAVATSTDNFEVKECIWTTGGTMDLCIDGTNADTADGVHIQDCRFPRNVSVTGATGPIRGFSTSEANLIENYIADASGGVLVTRSVG